MDNRTPTEVERVAAAIKPNLFRLYPGGKSFAHEQARQTARAVLAALSTMDSRSPDGVEEANWLRSLAAMMRDTGRFTEGKAHAERLEQIATLLVSDRSGERMREADQRCYSLHHNPNCPKPFLVRLPRGSLDLKAYTETNDALGFGLTFAEAFSNASTALDTPKGELK